MDAFIAEIKSSARRPGVDEILVPGEIDHRRETAYRRDGAQLDADVMKICVNWLIRWGLNLTFRIFSTVRQFTHAGRATGSPLRNGGGSPAKTQV